MNQEMARKLYEEGGIFIFLDVPEGTEFGIDMKSWNTGEKFRGVKMIPPGLHYIFYKNLVEKLSPVSGYIQSALELESCSDADRPRGKKTEESEESNNSGISKTPKRSRLSTDAEEDLLPNLKPKEGTEFRLTVFPERNYPLGATPSEITRHSLDSSYLLDTVLTSYTESKELLGELEFCYIKEIPEEFLADIVTNNNFVYVKLRNLFRAVQDSDVDGQLKSKVDRLKKSLTGLYQWDFNHLDSDEDDEAPVIVEVE
ncbi:hypothetical protein NQ318_021342 [Aromia moschata]|uniref:Protein AAR2 homolog n=1 Tax=Aromia moschata TaxID=1265417 RepID=A0AAV8ZBJ6_9CUCU|nr:hypothetical protein NQ318_021342 [Aromia moschata]